MPPTTPRMIRAAIVLYQEPDAFLQMQITGCRQVRMRSQERVWLSGLFTLAFAGRCWTLKHARRLFARPVTTRHQVKLACLCIWILPSLTRQGKCLKKVCFDSSMNNWKPHVRLRQKIPFTACLNASLSFPGSLVEQARLCPFTLAATTLSSSQANNEKRERTGSTSVLHIISLLLFCMYM